jgi:GT2 family glycosyltransferase
MECGSDKHRDVVRRSAVIVLHYGDPEITNRCISSIHTASLVPDIILVDNDPICRYLPPHDLGLYYLPQIANLGFAEGVNLGIRKAIKLGKEMVILLNNDVEVNSSTVAQLLGTSYRCLSLTGGMELAMDKNSRRTSKVIFAGGDLIWKEVPVRLRLKPKSYGHPYSTNFVRGSCMAFSLKIVQSIGLMDIGFFAYGEDVDYCIRASQAGWPLMIDPQARLWHRVASNNKEVRRNYLMSRNAVFLLRRYTKGKVYMRGMLLVGLAALSSIVRQERQGKFKGFFEGLAKMDKGLDIGK